MSLDPELLIVVLQSVKCKKLIDKFPGAGIKMCTHCVRRQTGDTCRFLNVRCLLKVLQTGRIKIGFNERQIKNAVRAKFPEKWNVALEPAFKQWTRRTVARALLPSLKEELNIVNGLGVIARPRELEVRATCDICLTSVFSSTWMCRVCGNEACSDCHAQIPKSSFQSTSMKTCGQSRTHCRDRYSPVTRFDADELANAIREMEVILAEDEKTIVDAATLGVPTGESNGMDMFPDTNATGAYTPPFAPAIPLYDIERFPESILSDETFHKLWMRGEPLLVTGLLGKFQIKWTPEYFQQTYGSEKCAIVECETGAVKEITVGEFFSWFGNYSDRRGCWKLKDWPPSADFASTFPELYEDFSRAVPVPNYVRRDGVLNLASHFPLNSVAPDLGPKMYNALASMSEAGGHGSTRLHMDMADALNIMTFAAPCQDGSPGCAAWDLFRAEDADSIRKFLETRFPSEAYADPIHSQLFYLDDELRTELWEEYEVKSYRVYQRPGEAVFIPAGCAHQVANMSDCVKVAIDFVSPENIARCEQLTKEFRELNFTTKWKEDILQLRTMMWFAWQSCSRPEV